MFEIKSEKQILGMLEPRKSVISNRTEIPELDGSYLSYVLGFKGMEITPDIVLFDYDEALRENRYLAGQSEEISERLWHIGASGQGDGWFMDRVEGFVLFFDHDQGDYLSLPQFESLKLAFLYRELENLLDVRDPAAGEVTLFKSAVNRLKPGLYGLYPFNYFEN